MPEEVLHAGSRERGGVSLVAVRGGGALFAPPRRFSSRACRGAGGLRGSRAPRAARGGACARRVTRRDGACRAAPRELSWGAGSARVLVPRALSLPVADLPGALSLDLMQCDRILGVPTLLQLHRPGSRASVLHPAPRVQRGESSRARRMCASRVASMLGQGVVRRVGWPRRAIQGRQGEAHRNGPALQPIAVPTNTADESSAEDELSAPSHVGRRFQDAQVRSAGTRIQRGGALSRPGPLFRLSRRRGRVPCKERALFPAWMCSLCAGGLRP
jgi:hypothetical protein